MHDVSPKMPRETLISPATAALRISFKLYILFMRKTQTQKQFYMLVSQRATKIRRVMGDSQRVTDCTF